MSFCGFHGESSSKLRRLRKQRPNRPKNAPKLCSGAVMGSLWTFSDSFPYFVMFPLVWAVQRFARQKLKLTNSHLYIYRYRLWSYYLGHVWGFLIVTNWATFVFLKRLLFKKHYKIGVSADFLFKKKRGPQNF